VSTHISPRKTPAWRRYLSFWGADTVADVDDELRFHIEMRAADCAAHGLPLDAARRRAEQRFGNVARARDACVEIDRQQARTENHMQMLIALGQDAAYALRVLRRQWVPALAAILCMAVGVSATAAMFSVVDTLLLRPLPYPNGNRLGPSARRATARCRAASARISTTAIGASRSTRSTRSAPSDRRTSSCCAATRPA
jgi:hypothetical protein